MRQESTFDSHNLNRRQLSNHNSRSPLPGGILNGVSKVMATAPRHTIVGALLILALLAFEVFNFDTTQFALGDLLGEISFINVRWATILAVAFCAIDFAGLAYLFGPERNTQTHHEVWYLMGAWLLGATMNALMTWWAVSITLLDHTTGNVILSHEELMDIVPLLVAVLVWVTRILFIGAFSVAGGRLLGLGSAITQKSRPQSVKEPRRAVAMEPTTSNTSAGGYATGQEQRHSQGGSPMAVPITARTAATNARVPSPRNTTRVSRSPQKINQQRTPIMARPARSGRR